jgi:hypothetical protein
MADNAIRVAITDFMIFPFDLMYKNFLYTYITPCSRNQLTSKFF